MSLTLVSPQPLRLKHFVTQWITGLFVAFVLIMAGFAAHAAPPPAGTQISNQATASYADGSGVTRTVNSNIVQTTVLQVASLTLTANGAQNATAGSIVYYPHTLTNTGNGPDTFTLVGANGTGFTMTSVVIFADGGSGQPIGPAITSTGLLAAGAQFRFIVAGTVPGAALAGATNTITVTGTSSLPISAATNTDTTTVTSNAVVTLTKAVSVTSGAPGSGPFTYSLTYTNNGNSNATSLVISDTIPAGLTYVAGSARWSVTGATPLSDSSGSSGTLPNTLTSSYTAGSLTFSATLAQVTPGQSGIISFDVNVAAAVAPGIRNNTATTSYNNGTATPATGSSNTVPFNVTQVAGLTMTTTTPITSPAAPGSSVPFTSVITNTGTGTDTFEITLGTNTFPVGTTFQIFRPDGTTLMLDTNGNLTVDTGPLAPNGTFNLIVRATLPPNATNANPTFRVFKTATSAFNPTKFVTVEDTLNAIAAASVDLRNSTASGAGTGAGPGAGVVVDTNTTTGGTSTVFTLVANNTGLSPDSYDLAAQNLPTGWTVTFRAGTGVGGSCSILGATVITNTGSVPQTPGSFLVCAVVSVPAGAPAATSNIDFRVLSPVSGATDILRNAVVVSASRSIVITNRGIGQASPGGLVVYTHTLTNNGNVIEGNGTVSSIALSTVNNQAGFTSTLYYDANNNGVIDATDPVFAGNLNTVAGLTAGLAPGASITVLDRVIAPSGATAGSINVTTITVTTTQGSYATTAPAPTVTTDTTTVIAGNLTLTQAQALDTALCPGPTGSTIYTVANQNALPNQCVLYQITVTNLGAANATNVVVSDSTPTFTTLSTAAVVTPSAGTTITQPAIGAAGPISAAIGTLTPGQSAVLTFGVRITP